MTPDQVLEMTPAQVRILGLNLGRTADENPLHEWWKWTRMSDAARQRAREIKGRYGRF